MAARAEILAEAVVEPESEIRRAPRLEAEQRILLDAQALDAQERAARLRLALLLGSCEVPGCGARWSGRGRIEVENDARHHFADSIACRRWADGRPVHDCWKLPAG